MGALTWPAAPVFCFLHLPLCRCHCRHCQPHPEDPHCTNDRCWGERVGHREKKGWGHLPGLLPPFVVFCTSPGAVVVVVVFLFHPLRTHTAQTGGVDVSGWSRTWGAYLACPVFFVCAASPAPSSLSLPSSSLWVARLSI